MHRTAVILYATLQFAFIHRAHSSQTPQEELNAKWSHDWGFSGIQTFAHLPHVRCLTNPEEAFDVGIVGVPFDTAVSYRPGARFGPRAIRAGSSRQTPSRAYNPRASINPYATTLRVLDCGDMPITPFDNSLALHQMSVGFHELNSRPGLHFPHPKLVTLGGDHSLALPALRSLAKVHGQPITVVHMDAHLDTWSPFGYDSTWLDPAVPIEAQQSAFTHGSMFWLAWKEKLIANGSVHAGLRTRLQDVSDDDSDTEQGWVRIASDEMGPEALSPRGIARKIMDVVGTERPVYLSVDIDVLDPGLAPGTGTPEPGGWLTRELIQLLRGLEELNVVGADLVEVSPSYDGVGEQTGLAAAQVVFEMVTSIVKRGLKDGVEVREGVGRNVGSDEL